MKFNKGFSSIAIIIIVIVLLAAGGVYLWQTTKLLAPEPSPAPAPATGPTAGSPRVSEADLRGWKTYRNEQYGFEFRYPGSIFTGPYTFFASYSPAEPEFLSEIRFCRLGFDRYQAVNNAVSSCQKKVGENQYLGPLSIRFEKDGSYTSYDYRLSFIKGDPQYEPVIIDGRNTFRSKEEAKNELRLIRLDNGYFIDSVSLNRLEDTCVISRVECGDREIVDKETRVLFNQIISNFKFTSLPKFEIQIFSPKSDDVWRIGDKQSIKLSEAINADFPPENPIGIDLVNSSGEFFGIIACVKNLPVPRSEFIWDSSIVSNFCGAAAVGKYKSVIPGDYKIVINQIVGGKTKILAESPIFSIIGIPVNVDDYLSKR